ncbi:MAG: T9SS type A sorting domain-containing protein [Ignavibacteriaceae bacterium]|jgi:plastocyanin|nr:T9SS type A sorting domain-containing protein [Ignavibacteriaceae bacterium]MCW8814138.1 T9SS type A sorting domain-containing protein [Chlorobium sp.]
MVKFKTLLFLFFLFVSISGLSFAQTSHVVEVRNFVFVPETLSIAVGDTVVWQWIEGAHTTTSDSTTGQNVWDELIDASHQVFRFVITAPGNHGYYCIPHQGLGMVGTIVATVSGVEDENNPPEKFQLSQNYPNPFNPSTTIKYRLTKPAKVTLKVYNLLGKEVVKLVSGDKNAGTYEVEFNASALPSGIYFYELKTGSFAQTKKMILMK